ncbi:oligosaccharyl transferase glycoprotein complex, beta subunit [Coemansia sp. RSA 2322]|uniref:Dolichyl-diphosphooligosaccharide--protein glycosyltransferase subunit WBP1 n=1 Tax=Coemansia thaxteri TaxID=2663907 RepID=A0A9W8EGA5_9FUNG|nr:oligosaccharyl transferase glycoprotein complex, beta subunit [Coemansia thaxteri]KAJ2474478.1 oligosaccharyl transferase glycoprotein complex, beta subunit [Coemansia sp. RSA 2322]KAJ2486067.1 oligosaccharyl transferase glycoprotein complex, beta subunit [Coemansia sp. RSA 2320]
MLGGAWLGAVVVEARSVSGDRVLVLVPKVEAAKQYSQLLGSLADRGFDVAVRAATNTSVLLQVDGVRLYDHAIVLSPESKKLGGSLTANDFARFVEDGGNLIAAASSKLSELQRKLASRFGIEYEKRGTTAIDHSSHLRVDNASDHTTVAARMSGTAVPVLSALLARAQTSPVYFKGIAHKYESTNPMMVPVLTGSRTTYSAAFGADTNEGGSPSPSSLSGRAVGLVSVFQARNNARVAFSGSVALFSDELLSQKSGANKQFVTEMSKWTLQEKAVLRETGHRHYLSSTGEQPEHYRVSNEIVYEVDLAVYHDNSWHPYSANDVQFEAIMLDPYIRATLNRTEHTESKTTATYRGDIKLPDRYGTFTFRVNYKRTGYSNVDVRDTVGIWPLRHDEYPRFLTAAYPYYTGSFVMAVGFLALCASWLWTAEPKSKAAAKAKSS